MTISKNLSHTNNELYKQFAIDPITQNFVSKICFLHSKKKKGIRKETWYMGWQYYRDRKRKSVEQFLKEKKGTKVRIYWSGKSGFEEREL